MIVEFLLFRLVDEILVKVDRSSMQHGLEVRDPLLGHQLIEFAFGLSDQVKMPKGQLKYLLKRILNKHVPEEIVNRPKQGFNIPIGKWLQSDFKEQLISLSEDKEFLDTYQLCEPEIRDSIGLFLKGDRKISPEFVWFLFNLYQWHLKWEKIYQFSRA